MFNQTTGLCGLMNDYENDDFKGPNGQEFSSHIDFVESWRMMNTTRNNGGLFNSWSFTLSNFHKDDPMDSSYTNTTHKPIYNLESVPQSKIDLASQLCSSNDLGNDDKNKCIYDVVLSDDPSIAKQGVLTSKQCKNQCSNRGLCKDKVCVCIDGWSGDYCQTGVCGECIYGNCSEGFCSCDKGFEGPKCDIVATCEGNCSFRGICIRTDVCECEEGWTTNNCSEVARCPRGCSNDGLCIAHNKCKCQKGYTGETCSEYTCESVNYCSNHGSCIGFDVCLCQIGWEGDSCSSPVCEEDCSLNGECIEPNKCLCSDGFRGDICDMLEACPDLNNCTNHGICRNSTECICDSGFTGRNCSEPKCNPPCTVNGKCVSPNECACDSGYTGNDCSQFSCESLDFCSSHGSCDSFDQCSCDQSWFGVTCSETSCIGKSNCFGNGLCIEPNVCRCKRGFMGDDCSQVALPNIEKPQFLQENYTVYVDESIPTDEYLVRIQAKDTDTGSTQGLLYTLSNRNISVKIDEITGILQSNGKYQPGIYHVEVIAVENTPAKLSSTALVIINVNDINDCAVIEHPQFDDRIILHTGKLQGSLVTRIETTDNDLGSKGQMVYEMISIPQDLGMIGLRENSSEIITKKYPLPIGRYENYVIVYDRSDNPCTSTSSFVVYIQQEDNAIDALTTNKPDDESTKYESTNPTKTNAVTTATSTAKPIEENSSKLYLIIGISSGSAIVILTIAAIVLCLYCRTKAVK
ncbi:unnamed protein product [Dimorphilus gyrociliatus]|uniref:Uncharacterized protein n=1 Tax=Dimorphilus gyrociliatus TaxID=2664684 RepID=A0A7I8WEP5_9ANNE|nr:unnamed protein product [Dimorphilus gyrociliatus]